MLAGNGHSKSADNKPNLNSWGQSGESVAEKAKGDYYRGFKKRNAEIDQEETGQEAPFSFCGLVAGTGCLSAAEVALMPMPTTRRASC